MLKQALIKITLIFVALIPFYLFAQKNDPVLFTVDKTPVHQSEFEYIYTKTNGKDANFSRASLEEYLDLYVKFKLKVQKAKNLQLDTIPQLKKELDGYRRQLADSYLIDKEVTEKLIQETYERAKQDVDISHVLINVKSANKDDMDAAYQQAMAIKKRLENGEDFAKVAKEVSSDKSAQRNGGRIGYVTVLFPNGFYPLETAAYTQEIGKLSDPILTTAGYHIMKVNARRPARGEIEAAHILIRKKEGEDASVAKQKIDDLYKQLQGGANFEELAKTHSEDKSSAQKGGNIGIFGINRFEKAFENTAFGLAADNDYSEPIETSVGWHIIKRISKKDIQPYNIEKSRLETKVKKDDRFEAAKVAMIKRIKSENNFTENTEVLDNFIGSLTDTFLTFKWKAPLEKSDKVLFSLGKENQVKLGAFTDYLGNASRKRLRMGRNADLNEAARSLYADFVNEQCLAHEEKQLEKKYPDFKALMREYQEGILLFEATKMLVWDKASQDSTGLEEFFKTIRGKYRWTERAVATSYRISSDNKDRLPEIRAFAATHSPEEVLAKFNTEEEKLIINSDTKTFEKGRNPDLNSMTWKVGELSQSAENRRNRNFKFVKIEELLPAAEKTLKEARGYVVADYQDQLEKEWVESLRKEFKVKIDEKVFESMVKKG